jgi:hypothetical protein
MRYCGQRKSKVSFIIFVFDPIEYEELCDSSWFYYFMPSIYLLLTISFRISIKLIGP